MPAPISANHYSDKRELGSGKQMWTDVTLAANGQMTARTRTRAYTMFGGYTGGVFVIITDPAGTIIGQSQLRSYGVNGTWVPGAASDRTDTWSEWFSQDVANRASRLIIVQMHTPTNRTGLWIKNTVEQAFFQGRKFEDILPELLRQGAGMISIGL